MPEHETKYRLRGWITLPVPRGQRGAKSKWMAGLQYLVRDCFCEGGQWYLVPDPQGGPGARGNDRQRELPPNEVSDGPQSEPSGAGGWRRTADATSRSICLPHPVVVRIVVRPTVLRFARSGINARQRPTD